MDNSATLVMGLLAVYLGLGVLVVSWIRSAHVVSLGRRRPQTDPGNTALAKLTNKAVSALNSGLRGRQLRFATADRFEQAGLRLSAGDFLVITGSAALVAGLLGFLLGGLGLAILVAVFGALGPQIWLSLKISRRQATFAEQLPDTLQTVAGSLKAGHSLLRALDAAADDSDAPMSDELHRVVNETRIGRDLLEALTGVAARTKSSDFLWTSQAIETQREVGGNLAEVLENVTDTIRERAQLGRQVRALSAEGRLSAIILVGLPIAFLLMLTVINPTYQQVFFTTLPGWLMLGACSVLLILGSLWLRQLIKPKY